MKRGRWAVTSSPRITARLMTRLRIVRQTIKAKGLWFSYRVKTKIALLRKIRDYNGSSQRCSANYRLLVSEYAPFWQRRHVEKYNNFRIWRKNYEFHNGRNNKKYDVFPSLGKAPSSICGTADEVVAWLRRDASHIVVTLYENLKVRSTMK